MKSLLLIRHAKSDWEDPGCPDIDRPLNKRGNLNAEEMAERLLMKRIIPQVLVSSPAVRAFTTAQYFQRILKIAPVHLQTYAGIYEASLATLLMVVNELENAGSLIALFGHNPGLTYLAEELTGENFGPLPTCSIVQIDFPFNDWRLVSGGTGILKLVDFPKNRHPGS